jgi:hypothetical protein
VLSLTPRVLLGRIRAAAHGVEQMTARRVRQMRECLFAYRESGIDILTRLRAIDDDAMRCFRVRVVSSSIIASARNERIHGELSAP